MSLTTTRFACTGNGSGTHVDCDFVTDDPNRALEHFERYDHDVYGQTIATVVRVEIGWSDTSDYVLLSCGHAYLYDTDPDNAGLLGATTNCAARSAH